MKDLHLMKDKDTRLLFHVPSSQFFEIGDRLYNKISDYLDGLADRDEELEKVFDMLEKETAVKKMKAGQSSRMAKVAFLSTQKCNLRCRYCFANYGHYTECQDMNMSIETYKDALDHLLQMYPAGIAQLDFFGGEPLLGFKEIEAFIPYCLEQIEKRALKPPVFGVTTNGTVFTGEMIDFFNKYNVRVTVSLDGPRELNDIARVSETGWSVFDKIKENLSWINGKRKFPLMTELTLNKQHVLHYEPGKAAEWMKKVHELGFDGGMVGVVESEDELLGLVPEDREKYMQMYKEITDYWFDSISGEKPFCNFDILKAMKALTMKELGSLPCGAGVNTLTITAKGEILPCYLLYGREEFVMGHVDREDNEDFKNIQKIFLEAEHKKPTECEECWVRNICGIWCRGFGYNAKGSMYTVSDPRCWTAEAMLESILMKLTEAKKDPEKYRRFYKNIMNFSNIYKEE